MVQKPHSDSLTAHGCANYRVSCLCERANRILLPLHQPTFGCRFWNFCTCETVGKAILTSDTGRWVCFSGRVQRRSLWEQLEGLWRELSKVWENNKPSGFSQLGLEDFTTGRLFYKLGARGLKDTAIYAALMSCWNHWTYYWDSQSVYVNIQVVIVGWNAWTFLKTRVYPAWSFLPSCIELSCDVNAQKVVENGI